MEDELVLDEVQISDELSAKYGISDPLIDRYGNVVFTGYSRLEGVDEYGELREGGFIFTSMNPEIAQQLQMGDKQFATVKARSYTQARRYLLGSDGRIYRFDYRYCQRFCYHAGYRSNSCNGAAFRNGFRCGRYV